MEILGFSLWSKDSKEQKPHKSIAVETNDGSLVVKRQDGHGVIGDTYGWTTNFDLDPTMASDAELITKYRQMSLVDTIDRAVQIIINEMVSTSAEKVVNLNLDRIEYSDNLKDIIRDEFDHVINLLGYNENAFEISSRWYIDGRMYYQIILDDEKKTEEGIGKLIYLDPRKVRKVRIVNQSKDQRTGADLYAEQKGFYTYSDTGFSAAANPVGDTSLNNGIQISEDSIASATSGLLDPSNTTILSYLHKAIRPLNQLKGLEDATMIYKLSRAPERRVFYIDVGNLPPAKAEQLMQKQMNQYRSKVLYDASTGETKSDPRAMTMIEDYWLPRRSDGRATEITTLPAGQMSGEMGELSYFLNKVLNSLNVPITRMDSTSGFSLGKTTEITRDEVELTKFISRLRRRFSALFLDLLKVQLATKNIINEVEFDRIRHLFVFEFESDNHFDEMLNLEVLGQRVDMLDRVVNYTTGGQYGTFFSKEFIYKKVLKMDDEEIKAMEDQIAEDKKNYDPTDFDDGDDDDSFGPNISRIIHSGDRTKAAIANDAPKKAVPDQKQPEPQNQ